jgi:tRNA(Arg) A34 adenosine deaminase TadA
MTTMNDEAYLRLAVDQARDGIAAGQAPFGTVLVAAGQVVSAAHNSVWRDSDPTAHAEVNAIRHAAARRGIALRGCVLYTTCEPCPMCLSACHWAKIDRIVYGASIADAAVAGFSELAVSAAALARLGGSQLHVEGGLLVEECKSLFELWRHSPGCRPY